MSRALLAWPGLPPLALQALLRFHWRAPAQLLLTVLGLALGVAVVIAIDLATRSASQAMEASARLLRPDATHQIVPLRQALDEGLYTELRTSLGITRAQPVLEGRIITQEGVRLPLIGTDGVAVLAAPAESSAPLAAVRSALAELLTTPGAVLATAAAAAELGLGAGDRLLLNWPLAGESLQLVGVLEDGAGGGSYLLADIATAQEVLGQTGRLSRIDLRLDEHEVAAIAALPAGDWRLVTVAETIAGFDSLTRSFRLNLQALSLLALLLGAFLIYSTALIAALRRRPLFGTLRSLGMSRGEIIMLLLTEILLLAGAAVVLGILLGSLLGSGLVRLVLQTLDDLYFSLPVDYYRVTPGGLLKGVLLGFGASLCAVLLPALEAVRGPPRQLRSRAALEARAGRLALGCALLALAAALSGALLLFNTSSLRVALPGMFLLLGAAGLAVPALTWWGFHALARLFAALDQVALAWAARSVAARLSRTGPALAALVLAVGSFVAIGLMIAGLRASVVDWLDYSLDADLYISLDSGLPAGLGSDELAAALRALPATAGISRSRRVALPDGQGLARLLAVAVDPGLGRWPLLRDDPAAADRWRADADSVLISEALARRSGLAAGDRLPLQTPAGERVFSIAGIFVDYSSEAGVVAMDLERYRRLYDDHELGTIGVFARPGQRPELLEQVSELTAAWPPLRAGDARLLRQFSLTIFDRTFTITRVLQLIAGLVAFIAMLNALRAQQLDAARELAVLNALGMDESAMRSLCRAQHLLLGLFAALLALPLGMLLALLLVAVVTPIAFGWSTSFSLDVRLLGEAGLLALLAALLAGWRVPLPGDDTRLLQAG